MNWWYLVLFLGGMLFGAGLDMLLVRYVVPPRMSGGARRIEGTDIVLEPDPEHHANHCA
jgi:hypothetical protein